MISPQYVDGLEQRIKELTRERNELSEQLKTSRRDYEVMNKFREGAEAERDALAAHVGEPVAYISHTSEGDVLGREHQFDAPRHTPLYTESSLNALAKDFERLEWLEQQARKSRTGISFDWVPTCEGESSGFRFMRRHFIGEPEKTLRDAIDRVMRAEGGGV